MAQRIEIQSITVPAGTAIANPLVTNLNWRVGHVVELELFIPPGPSGLLGIQIAHSNTVIIPHDPSQYLITDDEHIRWPLEEYPTAPAWSVRAYNTDVWDHTFQVRMLFNEIGAQDVSPNPSPVIVPAWTAVPGE